MGEGRWDQLKRAQIGQRDLGLNEVCLFPLTVHSWGPRLVLTLRAHNGLGSTPRSRQDEV